MPRQRKSASRDVHQEVTDRIVEALEAGTAPWVKPWNAEAGFPHNPVTGSVYKGVNMFLLWAKAGAEGYMSSRWVTFNNASQRKTHVRKGQKGTGIVFFKWLERQKDGETERFPLLRFFTVFNVDQLCTGCGKTFNKGGKRGPEFVCTGVPASLKGEASEPTLTEADKVEHAEQYFAAIHKATGITPKRGGARACYSPILDEIMLPEFGSFQDPASAYSTEAHEFGHATGHKSRLDRDLSGRFGSESYAAEELVAEMTSAFVCAQLGLQGKLQHPEYIGNWIKVLKGNKRAIFTAASLAKKAHAFLAEAAGEPLPKFEAEE